MKGDGGSFAVFVVLVLALSGSDASATSADAVRGRHAL
jgi:hypothetical protein